MIRSITKHVLKNLNDLVTIQMTNYCIRIPCHYILFTYVPMQHRLTLANMVGVLWTTYLTHKADLSKKEVMLSDHDVISDEDCEDMELES